LQNSGEHIILFDGVCNLCNGLVQFIIERDKKQLFKFSSLQSEFGQSILEKNGFPKTELDSFLFLSEGKLHQKSSAGLHVAKKLGGFWTLFYVFIIIPKPIRDWIYSFIAKNRYKWFGKQESCWLPSPELKSRFI
jgi:predicted DCC family thiol-disulfide oxidoreductase YuxK